MLLGFRLWNKWKNWMRFGAKKCEWRKCTRCVVFRWRVLEVVLGINCRSRHCRHRYWERGVCRLWQRLVDLKAMRDDRRPRWPKSSTSGPIMAKDGDPGGSVCVTTFFPIRKSGGRRISTSLCLWPLTTSCWLEKSPPIGSRDWTGVVDESTTRK